MTDLKSRTRALALESGFDAVAFTVPGAIPEAGRRLDDFLAAGRHGDMAWMSDAARRRRDPSTLWPEAKSVVMLGLNYDQPGDPLKLLSEPGRGAISIYARGGDYHEIIKKKLKRVAGWLQRESGAEVKVFVDTAPVMEKPLGEAAGLGWQGKHTNLVSREFGSWLFLGSIFTTAEFSPDESEDDHCGDCRRCLDICPTDAFPKPYQLDARRCISYLTIEHKGHVDREFRKPIGNRIFGCDDCLAVCPWNKFARRSREARFAARADTNGPQLSELLGLDDAGFRTRFRGTPIKRTGRDRFVRNVLIAAGNSGDASLMALVERLLTDASPLVRAMAVWACSQLLDAAAFARLRERYEGGECDPAVSGEWRAGDAS